MADKVDKVDMSLDDIIKLNKKKKQGLGQRGRGARGGSRGGTRGARGGRGAARGGASKGGARGGRGAVANRFKQFRGRVGAKAVAGKGVSPLNRGQNQRGRGGQGKRQRGDVRAQLSQKALQKAKVTQQRKRQAQYNRNRGLVNTGDAAQAVKINRNFLKDKMRSDVIVQQQQQINRLQLQQKKLLLQQQRLLQQQQQGQGIQTGRAKKRRWGNTQAASTGIMSISVENTPSPDVVVQVGRAQQQAAPRQQKINQISKMVQQIQEGRPSQRFNFTRIKVSSNATGQKLSERFGNSSESTSQGFQPQYRRGRGRGNQNQRQGQGQRGRGRGQSRGRGQVRGRGRGRGQFRGRGQYQGNQQNTSSRTVFL